MPSEPRTLSTCGTSANITGSPSAGIDAQELIDTRLLCREMHHYILNHRELYGLPRKFNIAFDGGGRVAVLEATNDIGFAAVRVGAGTPVPAGVYFRMLLGGITGHGTFAQDSGVLLEPREVIPGAVAVIRTFIAHGDRTDCKRARLKYLLKRWGIEKFLAGAAANWPVPWRLLPLDACEPRAQSTGTGTSGCKPSLSRDFITSASSCRSGACRRLNYRDLPTLPTAMAPARCD